MHSSLFETYEEWRDAITGRCGLTLDESYCKERISALTDDRVPTTAAFLKAYGSSYRDLVVSWFTRALKGS